MTSGARRVLQSASLGALLGIVLALPALAEDGCDKFAWSLNRERAWFAASDKLQIPSADPLPALPGKALILRLQQVDAVVFVMPPERRPKSANGFGGAVSFAAPEQAGIYQVTLSEDAWIDVVQEGRYVRSVGSSGRRDCPGLRKSVRLELARAPFVMQLSDVETEIVMIAVSARE